VTIDPASTATLTHGLHRLVDPLARAQVYSATWDMVRDAELSASRYVDLVIGNVAHEEDVGVLQRLLQRAASAAERYAAAGHREALLARLAAQAREEMEGAEPGGDRQLAWTRHWATCARGAAEELVEVAGLLDGHREVPGLTLDADLRWHLLTSLARAGAVDEDRIDDELERDPTDLGQRHAATARAARPDPEAKGAVWRQLLEDTSLSHTMSRQLWGGFNQLDQVEVLAPFTQRYFDVLGEVWEGRSLDWAIEFSTAMFPHHAASEDLLATVDEVLARGTAPGPLRRVLLEQRDTLVRTLAARRLDQG
jgi:aminopeptidase N